MYIPLFNKSNYSLLSSLLKIDDIVSYAKESNISEIAIADTNMYGTMEFINKCKKEDIKPIIGLHVLLEEFSIVLYAKDYDGYKSLIKLSSIQNERKVTKEELSKYNKNVIAILPYESKETYKELTSVYEELYIGYRNKKEQTEVLLQTTNIVFFRESLYLTKNDESTLPYLFIVWLSSPIV